MPRQGPGALRCRSGAPRGVRRRRPDRRADRRAGRPAAVIARDRASTKTKTRWSPSGSIRAWSLEATTGFEPVNRGFADLRVEPLHHVAVLAAPRGFEPRFTDPKSAVLPLDEGAAGVVQEHTPRISRAKKWSGRRDSNPRPSPWQGDALPTEPLPLDVRPPIKVVPRARFELATPRFSVACSTN